MAKRKPQIVDIRWPSAFGIFGLGILVGAIICVFQVAKVTLSSGSEARIDMEYTDLVVILLAVLGVMFALGSVVLGALAVFGYQEIKANAARRAEEEVKRQLKEGGELREYLKDTVERLVYPDVGLSNQQNGDTNT